MEKNKDREQDVLAQAFRKKLTNHTLPVDSSAWDAIQLAVAVASTKGAAGPLKLQNRKVMWWIPLSVAASLALLITFGWLYQSNVPEDAILVAEESTPELLYPQHVPNATSTSATHPVMPVSISTKSPVALLETVFHPNSSNGIVESVAETLYDKDEAKMETLTKESEPDSSIQPSVKKTELPSVMPASADDWTRSFPAKKQKPLLAAGLGSGFSAGTRGSSGMYFDAMSESFLTSSNAPMRAKALSPADFDQKNYLPPLSGGVKIRLPFNDTWSFETGLQYTYLHTNLSYLQGSGHTAEMQLHYLGLPVGFAATLNKSSKWDVYVSGGLLAEKGLQSVYNEYRDWGSAVFNTTVSKGIDGMQWSVFTSIGAGYKLDRNTMLYVEPQLSYFFENAQPLSIRTEMPLMLGLSAGIRFTL